MNTFLPTLLGLLGLALVTSCASSSKPQGGGGGATVTFVNPENYTDFRGSGPSGNAEREKMCRQLDAFIRAEAARQLPAGRQLDVRITNIDQGGETSSRRGSGVRVASSNTSAEINVEYTLTGAEGQTVSSGSDRLIQSASSIAFPERSTEDMVLLKSALRSWIGRLAKL